MTLYVAQHGEALPKDVDPDRPLSEQGRTDVQRVGATLARAGLAVPHVLHSGKTRARQSAELLAERLAAPGSTPVEREGLKATDPAGDLAATVASWGEDALIVSHLPLVGRLVARLVAGDEEREVVAFQPGTVACLEPGEEGSGADGGGWRLAWMLRPGLAAAS